MIDIHGWVDIPGYEGLYQICIDRNIVRTLNYRLPGVVKELKGHQYPSGHIRVSLTKEGITRSISIHQIVMFIKEGPCPAGLEVCHNDGNPQNNHPDNLRYGTHSDNMHDAVLHGTHPGLRIGGGHPRSQRIVQSSLEGVIIRIWESTIEASKSLGISKSNITSCKKGLLKTAGGFKWYPYIIN